MGGDAQFYSDDWAQELVDRFARSYGWDEDRVFRLYWDAALRYLGVIRRREAAEQLERLDAAAYPQMKEADATRLRQQAAAQSRAGLRYVPIEERVDPEKAARLKEIEVESKRQADERRKRRR